MAAAAATAAVAPATGTAPAGTLGADVVVPDPSNPAGNKAAWEQALASLRQTMQPSTLRGVCMALHASVAALLQASGAIVPDMTSTYKTSSSGPDLFHGVTDAALSLWAQWIRPAGRVVDQPLFLATAIPSSTSATASSSEFRIPLAPSLPP